MEERRSVKARRLEAGLTLEELAAEVGVHRTTIGKLERNGKRVSAAVQARIDQVLAEHATRQ